MELRLNTSLETLDMLHKLADKKGNSIEVDSSVLKLLLIDHSNLVRTLKEKSTVKIVEPKHRERL
jgi:hypothetical protein